MPLPIHVAYDNSSIVRLLLTVQANVNDTGRDNKRVLLWASKAGATATMSLAIQLGWNVNESDPFGMTLMHCDAERSSKSTLKLLLIKGKAVINKKESRGKTPLHHATERYSESILASSNEAEAAINKQNSMVRTPPYWASVRYSHSLKLLIKTRANVEVMDAASRTLLYWAIQRDLKEYVIALNIARANMNAKHAIDIPFVAL